MKLRYLNFTALVSTMIMAGTAGAAEIYNKDGNKINLFGKLSGKYYFTNDDEKSGDHSSINCGIRGETTISDKLVGFGMIECDSTLQHAEGYASEGNVCIGYAGIKFGNFGSFDFGRNYGILYDIGAWTNVMPELGGSTFIIDNFLSHRASNILTYRNSNFFGLVKGLNLAIQYQAINDSNIDTNRSIREENGNGYGFSLSYSFDNDFSAALAYSNSKHTDTQNALINHEDDGDDAETYSLGLKYDANNFYLAALYSETYNMTPFGTFEGSQDSDNLYGFVDRARNVELAAQYQFEFGLRPFIGYIQSRANDIKNSHIDYLKRHIGIGTTYNVNKNTSTFIDYRINLLKSDNFTRSAHISTDNILAIGVSYTF